MSCLICEEDCVEDVCAECVEKLKTKFAIKCKTCGAVGFLLKTEKNIKRMTVFTPDFEARLAASDFCVVPMPCCPECKEVFDIMHFGGFTSGGGLVH